MDEGMAFILAATIAAVVTVIRMVLQGRRAEIRGDVKLVFRLWAIGLLVLGIIIVVFFIVMARFGGV
jgi:hypothetical protein